MDCTCKAPLFMGFPRQEYWSGLPFPSPGHLPNSGIKPSSPALARGFFTTELPGKSKLSGTSAMVFPVVMYGCESRTIKKAEHWRNDVFELVLEKTLEIPLDHKEIQPAYPKRNQLWIFIGRTDVEAETLILRPPDVRNWLTGKDPDAGKHWRQEEKVMTEDKIAGWHHLCNGHEYE